MAAEETTRIERDRRHTELTPAWSGAATVRSLGTGTDNSRVRLTLHLTGPAGLNALDRVSVRIRNNETHTPVVASDPTQDDLDRVVWGPYRFVPGVDGADQLGRTVADFPLRVGEERGVELEPSRPPAWVTDPQDWAQRYRDTPIRLEITCRRAGYEPWTVLVDVDQPLPKFHPRATRRGDGSLGLTSSPRLKPGDSNLAAGSFWFIDGRLPALGAGRSHTISAD